ncbi:MAG: amine dehydrogenase large subunit [Gammaproteobacteria bacterium]|nr:amine dehydrogenase large subunit [Gammaproteobacteria bacterium]
MRSKFLAGVFLLLAASASYSDIAPETAGVEKLGQPTDDWFINRSGRGAYLFDSASGDMLGLLSLTVYTPAIAVNRSRGEVYAAESYLSRLYRGKREDVLTVYDITTLSPVAEIDIPDKAAEVTGDINIGLMGNGRHVTVYNLTPAQSVSVVDVENRRFAAEISTPGCAMIMPVNDASFLMVCGDGSVQLIRLANDGTESNRVRSGRFFSVDDDAVFDRAARTRDGWLLVSHAGLVYDLSVDDAEISVSEPWSLVSDEERNESWRPGGSGLLTVNRSNNLAFVLMHQGKVDTHHEPGSELWIFDTDKHRRVMRWVLDEPWSDILVLQGEEPKLIAVTDDGELHVYDALRQRFERTIAEPGPGVWLLQGF